MFRSLALAALLLLAAAAAPAPAAETEIVGLAAVAIEPEVAARLDLTAEQRESLEDLVDRREMKGMSLAMKSARLPKGERVAKLAEFRSESERQALTLLTAEQATALREIAAERDDAALKPAAAAPAEAPEVATDQEVVSDEPAEKAPSPAAAAPATRAESVEPDGDGLFSFNFKQQPWGEVIRWFADRADLSVVVDSPPPGTLTYRDTRRYTAAGALDVLNGVLLTKGYTLVRKDRMLLVINLEQDKIPPNIVTDVPLDELDQRGEYELVRVLIELGDINPAATADSLGRLTGPQGTIVVLPEARMLQVTETAGRIRTMLRVVDAMRRAAAPRPTELVVRSYSVGGADGKILLKVLYAVLADSPTAQMEVDADAGTLIARATPDEHAVIEETLERLRSDGRRVEVIAVDQVDPLLAASIVTRLFNPDAKGEKGRDPNAPVVEADRTTDSLLVRGTPAQVEQVRQLVEQLDTADETPLPGAGGPIRTLPIPAMELQQAWPQIEMLWPQLRANPLRSAGPMGGIPSFRPGAEAERERMLRGENEPGEQQPQLAPPQPEPAEALETRSAPVTAGPFRFASDRDAAAPIFVSPGATSTVLASRDAEALDALESLLASVLGPAAGGDRQFAVFYLKFADATTASTLLGAIFGGESGGGSLMSDLAGAAMGDGGDLLGGLLGGGDSGAGAFDSVSVDLVPDVRLNAIYARASATDLQTINQMLRVIDQPRGPDRVEATGVTRLIRVETDVDQIATVVRQVYQDRLQGAGGGSQPSPQDLIRALAGGGGASAEDQEPERMTIGVDQRSNSLVVRSSEPLFEEVSRLVAELDQAGADRPVSTRVVSLRNTSSDALRQTLVSLLGDKAVLGGEQAAQSPAQPNNRSGGRNAQRRSNPQQSGDDAARQQRREFRRQMQGLQQLQRAMQQFRQQQGGGRGGRGGGQPRGGQRPGR